MLYNIIYILISLIPLVVAFYIFRQMHRAAIERNHLLYDLKEEIRKLRKTKEPGRDADDNAKHF